MADAFEQQEWVKFGVAASLSRQYASDQRAFLELLAQMLEHALPDETEIERKGGLFSKKTVHCVSVMLGNTKYVIEDPGKGPLTAACIQIVRGIALKTQETPVDVWLAEIGEALDERAKSSAQAREALAKMLE